VISSDEIRFKNLNLADIESGAIRERRVGDVNFLDVFCSAALVAPRSERFSGFAAVIPAGFSRPFSLPQQSRAG
jgi:hypothetical protein